MATNVGHFCMPSRMLYAPCKITHCQPNKLQKYTHWRKKVDEGKWSSSSPGH